MSQSNEKPYHWPSDKPIILAATPIGNTLDACPRLIAAIEQADVIAAEDTRRALNLFTRLGVKTQAKLVSYHEHNEKQRSQKLIELAKTQHKILMISDAGMPSVSDPGLRLAQTAVAENVDYTVIPGPSAPVTALALSAIATNRFCFEGFLPRKDSELEKYLQELKYEKRTMIFFESPRRIAKSVEKMSEVFGAQRQVAICRELTKVYEEVIRGNFAQILEQDLSELLGEVTIVVAGAKGKVVDPQDYVQEIFELVDRGMKLKEATSKIAEATGASKNELYKVALAHKNSYN